MSHITDRPKILFVLPSLEAGGAERVLITLLNGLDENDYDRALLSIQSGGALETLVDPAISLFSLHQSLSPFSLPRLFFMLKKVQPDVVFSTMLHMNFAVLALKPFFPKTKFIVREAITPSYLFEKHTSWAFLIKALYKGLYPKSHLVLSPTNTVFEEFRNDLNMDLETFLLMKNPVDVDCIRGGVNVFGGQNGDEKLVRFIACGRLVEQKGFDRLISQLAQFNIPYQWRFDIIGEGPERERLEILIEQMGLQNKVFLQGLILSPYDYFAGADCFLMPSRYEGLPNVVLEALACGAPVIATSESGGINEIAHDCIDGAVKVVSDMTDFITEMKKITPASKQEVAPSLLGECYLKEVIVKSFSDLLRDISNYNQI